MFVLLLLGNSFGPSIGVGRDAHPCTVWVTGSISTTRRAVIVVGGRWCCARLVDITVAGILRGNRLRDTVEGAFSNSLAWFIVLIQNAAYAMSFVVVNFASDDSALGGVQFGNIIKQTSSTGVALSHIRSRSESRR